MSFNEVYKFKEGEKTTHHWGFCHNLIINQQPTKTTIKNLYTFETTKPLMKFRRYLLRFDFFQIFFEKWSSSHWNACHRWSARIAVAGRAPIQSVLAVGRCRRRWVWGDGVGLLAQVSLGVQQKPPSKTKTHRCVLNPTCTTASDVASPKMMHFFPVNGS